MCLGLDEPGASPRQGAKSPHQGERGISLVFADDPAGTKDDGPLLPLFPQTKATKRRVRKCVDVLFMVVPTKAPTPWVSGVADGTLQPYGHPTLELTYVTSMLRRACRLRSFWRPQTRARSERGFSQQMATLRRGRLQLQIKADVTPRSVTVRCNAADAANRQTVGRRFRRPTHDRWLRRVCEPRRETRLMPLDGIGALCYQYACSGALFVQP